MSTTTTNYGLIKPDITDPILIGQLNDNADTIDATMKSISDALDVAKLGIKYKGEVNYYADLPNSAEIGDAYTVKYAGSSGTTPDGTEYVWGAVSGVNQWINFSKDSYSKAEVDALLALKQNALTTAQLAAVNSGIDSTKVAQIETNKNNISWNYTETRYTNTGTSDYENTGISFTAPANQSIEFYAYDRKDGAYLDKILVCDSLTTLGNTTIVSANSIIDGFTDAQYWTLQTTGIVPTFNTDVTYYIWVKRKSTGSNLVGLAWRYLSR